MSDTRWKLGCTVYEANRFQPDCCSSLVYAWFGAMKLGESAGEQWCAKAHREAADGPFYAHHIARNDLIQGQSRLNAVKNARDFSQRAIAVGQAIGNVELLYVARDLTLALNEPIQNLLNKKSETDAQKAMGFRVINQWTDNVEVQLGNCLKELSAGMRFYMLSVAASERGHVVGIVSTKSEGWFSPNGYLYYYDPNLRNVSQWRSRDDLIQFMKTLNSDYRGFRSLTELGLI